MANTGYGSIALNKTKLYKRLYELTQDCFINLNNKIACEIRFNIILQAILRYRTKSNDNLRFRIKEDTSIIIYKGWRELVLTKGCKYRAPLILCEKKMPYWSEFIKILNATFYEKSEEMYFDYLRRATELCEDDNLYPNMSVNLLVKPTPIEYSVSKKVDYVSTTKMMIKGYETGRNGDRNRIFRNVDCIVYCEMDNHYISEDERYIQYTNRVIDGLKNINEEYNDLNKVLIYELKNLVGEIPLLGCDGNLTECCVCYEDTLNKTWCKHPLCGECYNKMPKPKKCPMCRSGL